MVCAFSISQLSKVLRACAVLRLFTSKFASRHNGVQFFIPQLPRWLRTRRFSEPIFRPSGATNQWKNTAFRDFLPFSRTCIFSLLTFSLSELLPGCAFPSVHIVGNLASKLPWTIVPYFHPTPLELHPNRSNVEISCNITPTNNGSEQQTP